VRALALAEGVGRLALEGLALAEGLRLALGEG